MARESTQHKIDRVRTPRVHITYDVETGGALEKKEIPFIVGVLGDLSGKPATALPRLAERKWTAIDRDNLDQVMAAQKPRVDTEVANKISREKDPGKLRLDLEFKCLADFEPENIAKNYAPLRELLEVRRRLSSLRTTMSGRSVLEDLLRQAVAATEKGASQGSARGTK